MAEVNQSRGASPPDFLIKSRPRRTARPILLAYCFHISQDAPNGVENPLGIWVLMLSRQTLVPDSTDAISASDRQDA